jgi:hypothetical protein
MRDQYIPIKASIKSRFLYWSEKRKLRASFNRIPRSKHAFKAQFAVWKRDALQQIARDTPTVIGDYNFLRAMKQQTKQKFRDMRTLICPTNMFIWTCLHTYIHIYIYIYIYINKLYNTNIQIYIYAFFIVWLWMRLVSLIIPAFLLSKSRERESGLIDYKISSTITLHVCWKVVILY